MDRLGLLPCALAAELYSVPTPMGSLSLHAWEAAAAGVVLVAWCTGWLVHAPCLELYDLCFRAILTLARLLLYCLPCCRRRDPERLSEASVDLRLRPKPLALASLDELREQAAPDGQPPRGWSDPLPREQTLQDGSLRPPICRLLDFACRGSCGAAVEWRRAEEVLTSEAQEVSLFGQDGPSPLDIEQGNVGDCYLLSAAAVLAQEPEQVRRLFLQQEVSQSGIYCVFLAKHGTWREVWIDDVVPVRDGKPFMARSNGTGKLWPLLLEKAWVALYGQGEYLEIDSGYPQYPLHALTNCPVIRYDTAKHSLDALWEALTSDMDCSTTAAFCSTKPFRLVWWPPAVRLTNSTRTENCASYHFLGLLRIFGILCAQVLKAFLCCPIVSCRLFDSILERCVGQGGCSGIVDGHAYSLLGAFEVPTTSGTERLVKLRNPWGETEWRGRYSDGSSAWTAHVKELVKLEERNDGVFFMSWADFVSYFAVIALCYSRPGKSVTPLPCRVPPVPPAGPSGALRSSHTHRLEHWHWRAYRCEVDESRSKERGRAREAIDAGCRLIVPSACEVFVTVDDPSEEGHSGYYSSISQRRCVCVFDLDGGRLVGRSQPMVRDIRAAWDPREDSGSFDELTSQSTTRMDLLPGSYLVKISWHGCSRPGEIPDQLVLIVTASASGLELLPLPSEVDDGSSSGGYDESSDAGGSQLRSDEDSLLCFD